MHGHSHQLLHICSADTIVIIIIIITMIMTMHTCSVYLLLQSTIYNKMYNNYSSSSILFPSICCDKSVLLLL